MLYNRTIDQCLCVTVSDYIAFNWFPNGTCQLFRTFPVTYKLQRTPNTSLYFTQGIFPNESQCCMSNLTELLDKLQRGHQMNVNTTEAPRNLIIDGDGFLVTVLPYSGTLVRYHRNNLSLINRMNVAGSATMAVAYWSGRYYIGHKRGRITVINRNGLSTEIIVNRMQSTSEIRSIMFLDHGQIMACSSNSNNAVVFFNQTFVPSFNLSFAYSLQTNYPGTHGLTHINDSFFYSTSYNKTLIYSHTAIPNNSTWQERFVLNGSHSRSGIGGTFVAINDCGRLWYSIESSVVKIFGSDGTWLANFSIPFATIIDTLITDNYVMFFSDRNSSGQIIRIDPHIEC